jgi:DNA-binding NarL/FixJ family response regulator
MSRTEWQSRARELAPRGQELPHAKLLDIDVVDIRSAHRQRLKLLQYIRDNLSNAAIAKKHGVHHRTIEKIVSYESWGHVA